MELTKTFNEGGLYLGFNEETHTYFNVNTGEILKSVTTLSNDYKEKFDKTYFSKYEAWKRVLGEDVFNIYKKKLGKGGYLKVVGFLDGLMSLKDREKALEIQKQVIIEWDDINKTAVDKGSLFHKKKEDEVGKVEIGGNTYTVNKGINFSKNLACGIYHELFICDTLGVICGQVDKTIINTNKEVIIRDYKTNKKLDFTSFRDKRMKPPFTQFPDCNFYHYVWQLNMYATLFEDWGYKVIGLFIDYIPDVEKEEILEYTVPRYKELFDNFLNDYRNGK